jgi:drug/metabolite transporter (DMT)-like permease
MSRRVARQHLIMAGRLWVAGRLEDAKVRGAVCGVLAAALFGASAPVAKCLLPESGPLVLASLLYLGAGIALSVALAVRRAVPPHESPLRRADVTLLVAITLSGGVVGPVLMLVGLERVSGVVGSLLLNLEGPFTMLAAVVFFGEHLDRRAVLAAALIVGGGLVFGWHPQGGTTEAIGALALAGACACWALDNNLTQRLALRDPAALVRVKALGAAAGNLLLALAFGSPFPPPAVVGAALALGAASYGLSIVLDTYALRLVGAAREAAYFATAPFFGAILAIPLLGESLGPSDVAAGGLMAMGVMILIRARHAHLHPHEALVHDHGHVHDEHHRHEHDSAVPPDEAHSHVHAHTPLVHDHPHVSDAHHRHRH